MARRIVGLEPGHGHDPEEVEATDLALDERDREMMAVIPNTRMILDTAKSVCWQQVYLIGASHKTEQMGMEKTKQFCMLVDSLTKLCREEREQEKLDDPSDLTDEEIREMLEDYNERAEHG